MNTPQPMNMRDGTVVSEKMEPVVPPLVCRDVKATKRRFNAVNGNAFNAVGSEIRIPVSGNFVLDNKNVNLNCKLVVTGANTATFGADFSWASLFSQIRVEAGSGSSIILEQLDDPGLWSSFLYQYTWDQADISIQNAKQLSAIAQPATATGIIAKRGSLVTCLTANPVQTVNIAIDLSQFMGIFYASSGIPLYDTNGLTVVFTLNALASMGVSALAAITAVSINDPYITCSCLEGGEKYEKALKEMKSKNSEVSIMFNTCRRYIQTVSAGGGATSSLLIGDKAKSVLGFVAMARDTANITTATAISNSSSQFPLYKNHVYQIAGENFPTQPITGCEGIDEAYDLYAQLARRDDSAGLLSRVQASTFVNANNVPVAYADAATQLAELADPATSPSQVLAVNLSKCGPNEMYWGKGKNLSGSSLNTYLNVDYTTLNAQTITIFSVFQMKVHIDAQGGFTTEF